MNGDRAAEDLRTIRTLMERATLYRCALAPIMVSVGCLGLGAALLGWKLELAEVRPFILYWLAMAAVACGVAFGLMRRQALLAGELVWSPPARRVVRAALPALGAGLLAGLALALRLPGLTGERAELAPLVGLWCLPLVWVVLYGCALHAAGCFMPRGMRLFGWAFVLTGCALFAIGVPELPRGLVGHGVMGFFFGLLHQAYGVYLYLTEQKESVE